jgi:hypothetical protein
MNRDMIEAAVALAATLAQENAALAAMDLAGAAGLLAEKEGATMAFTAAQRRAGGDPAGPLTGAQRDVAEQLGRQLSDLAAENRRLLERAILVQRRVVGTMVAAVPKAMGGAARYGATGAMAATRRPPPVVMSSRA